MHSAVYRLYAACNSVNLGHNSAKKMFHGSRETRLEARLSASVGTPPPFKDQGADAAPKAVGAAKLRY